MAILDFIKNPNEKFVALLEYIILVLVVFYFTILALSEYRLLGLSEPIILIPDWLITVNQNILWLILSLLSLELVLKYFKISDSKKFLKKYWMDITMLVLIPVFAGVKIFKVIKLAKKIKLTKYGYKVFDKSRKITK